jgi:uncharacterized protein involved in exopolysaccharide biosynthesis
MSEDIHAGWEPASDPEYLQRLLPFLLRRYCWWLLAGALLGGAALGCWSLTRPAVYASYGTVQVDGGGDTLTAFSRLSMLRGTSTGQMEDERLVLLSREIGWPVVEKLGMQISVEDTQGRDAPLERAYRRLGLHGGDGVTRMDEYNRLRLKDVEISEELLEPVEFIITADANGSWTCNGKSGQAGTPVELGKVKFTPIFGSGHQAGYRYTLLAYPREEAWRQFRGDLSVDPATDASQSILAVRFRYHNPVLAKDAVAQLIEEYMAYRRDRTYGEMETVLSFIADESAKAQDQLEVLTAELDAYREAHGVYSPTNQGAVAVQSIAQLSQQRTDNLIQIKRYDALLSLLERQDAAELYENPDLPSEAKELEGEFIQLANLVRELKIESETKTEAHPDIKALKTEINVTTSQIKESLKANRQQAVVANKQLDSVQGTYQAELTKLPAAESKVMLLTAEIAGYQKVLETLKEQETTTLLGKAGTSLKTQVLDAPEVPLRRDSPKVTRDAILGGGVGFMLVAVGMILLETQRRRIRSLREIRLGAGLRVVSVLAGPSTAVGRWQPREVPTDQAQRLAAYLAAAGKRIGVIHQAGPAGGYDLAWMLSGVLGGEQHSALLVDSGFLEAGLTRALGQEPGVGLTEAALRSKPLTEIVIKLEGPRALLRPGIVDAAPVQIQSWLAQPPAEYSAVMVCLPPVQQWVGHEQWLDQLDTLVLSMPQGAASLDELRQTTAIVQQAGASLRGVVVTAYSRGNDYLAQEELRLVTVRPAR